MNPRAPTVWLREITPDNRAAVEGLQVSPEQSTYVGSVTDSLAEALDHPRGDAVVPRLAAGRDFAG